LPQQFNFFFLFLLVFCFINLISVVLPAEITPSTTINFFSVDLNISKTFWNFSCLIKLVKLIILNIKLLVKVDKLTKNDLNYIYKFLLLTLTKMDCRRNRCIPDGNCLYCGKNKAQLPDYSYCRSCEIVSSNPGGVYPKCRICDRYHNPAFTNANYIAQGNCLYYYQDAKSAKKAKSYI
jgi:hypothetical protein